MDPRLSVRVSRARTKGNGGERRVLTDWMVDWSGCGGARSALTPAFMPKRRVSWVSPISLFMLLLCIVDALRKTATPPLTLELFAFFLCGEERKLKSEASGLIYSTGRPKRNLPYLSPFVKIYFI